jgi:hypothetical protein
MKLDLRKDFDDIYAYLLDRVQSFDPKENPGPGRGGTVTFIEFGFQCDQDGWVALVFDTRPDAEPDGEWNSYIENTLFARPRWKEAALALETGAVEATLPDGATRKLTEETDFETFIVIFGDLLKSVLLKARANGIFTSLPTAEACRFGVEELDGRFGWPNYEDRGKDDLV